MRRRPWRSWLSWLARLERARDLEGLFALASWESSSSIIWPKILRGILTMTWRTPLFAARVLHQLSRCWPGCVDAVRKQCAD